MICWRYRSIWGHSKASGWLSFGRLCLSIKNYHDLRVVTRMLRLLVVLELPTDESRWMAKAARSFRERAPPPNVRLHGFVRVRGLKDDILKAVGLAEAG